ncbi:exodeoxyribonuclease VII large subunit [Chitinibacter fontanus]|uniref:exodeoxyribonuclease VII large subunit n=1 Tax=Chitinibacter fontanus TaxID=1737446 RepID=UPI001D1327BB|nr:exodeoxyribonuclease VII large subunit [Chitinibacter fontanus]
MSVTQLNRDVRMLLETGFPSLWVAGEISNFKRYDSGHCYFSLKDANAQVRCVMFRGRAALLDFAPREGLQVEVRAVVSLYEARGDFQLTIEAMRMAGQGALFERFEALKKQLAAEGLFANERKQALPHFPRRIGIVTSPAAAALRDVLTTLARRMPNIEIILYPTAVQGADAAKQIARAIAQAASRNEVDTLIICRGGGSLEDLWSFNEEIVARAIAACPIPTVSGVGHETDFTMADFVSDVRAPTPTAAAELVSPNRAELLQRLSQLKQRQLRVLQYQLQQRMQQLDQLARRLIHPGQRLSQQKTDLHNQARRLQQAMRFSQQQRTQALARQALQLSYARPNPTLIRPVLQQKQQRLQRAIQRMLEQRQQYLKQAQLQLMPWDPQQVLSRGYALVSRPNGQIVRSALAVRAGDALQVRFADEQISVEVRQGIIQQPELEL